MGWVRNLLALFVLLAAGVVPADPAKEPLGIMLTAAERGVDDEPDPAAARKRLHIAELNVDAKIVGPMADIQIDMLVATGSSEDDRQEEARLTLALPDDAVVTGYALDVNGKLIPGQLLEQAKARNVYEDTVRRGIDPGLAEVTAQNKFQTQIYPVTRERPRRFRLRFSAPFDPARGLTLPLGTELPVDKTHLTISAQGYGEAPALRFAGKDLPLQRAGSQWQGSADLADSHLAGGFWLGGGKAGSPISLVRHANGRQFFVISDQSGVAAAGLPQGERLRVYWDRSLSHKLAGTEDEIAALVALAERARPAGIDLVTFASGGPRVIALADGAALRRTLSEVTYRGATTLAGLDDLKLPDAKRCLLVSDGRITLDHGAAFRPDCPLSVLSAGPAADAARLGQIAQRQQGNFIRIAKGKGADAAAALGSSSFTVVAVRDDGGNRVSWRALDAAPGHWLVVGELPDDFRLPSRGALSVRVAGPDGRVIDKLYETNAAPIALDAPGVLWASDRLAELSRSPADHEAMVKLARSFQVAGPAMAFLVLDNPRQYLNADIAPPQGFPTEWMQEYAEAKAEIAKDKRGAADRRLTAVIEQWQHRKEWWNRSFTPPKRYRAPDADRQGQPVPVPAPAMAPPPPGYVQPASADDAVGAAEPARREVTTSTAEDLDGTEASQIVVTGSRIESSNQGVPVAVSAFSGQGKASVEVRLTAMLADRPYLKALDSAGAEQRLAVLATQEAEYGTLPAFYFDVAEWFRLKGDPATARELLLSALELPESNDETLQIVAFRLERDGDYEHAVQLAERLAAGASFRPQPLRILALALADRGKARGRAGLPDLERAFTLLTKVALAPEYGTSDFDGLEVISLMEANALIPRIEALDGEWELDQRLVGLLDTDARIVIEWTADDADIDLWVDEPSGERVMYSHALSKSGGQISNDMTDGYGPEEYTIRRAPPGTYRVRVNGFDADRINPNGPGHVLVRLGRNFARPSQSETLVDVDLSFQTGGNRNDEGKTRPVAELLVN